VGKRFYGSFKLDENCYLEYAQKLIPRAVGYSKAMLDYFFRGDLKVTIPADIPQTSSRIRLNVHNSTTTGEDMNGGSIDLMVIFQQYKKDGAASSGAMLLDGVTQYRKYTLPGCPADNLRCNSIGKSDTTLDFDLSSNPLPPLATDISLVLVYRGKLGNEPDAIAFDQVTLDRIDGDLQLALPTRGVYASTSEGTISGIFNDFALAAKNTSATLTSGPGTTELLVLYRQSMGDPFQTVIVDLSSTVYYSSAAIPTPQGISRLTKTELLYALADAPLPVTAADVFMYLIHTDNDGKVLHGVLDISEPTPVDVYNNTDYTCLNNTWYRYDDPVAMAIVDSNGDGNADRSDIYPHAISNISFLGGSAGAGALDASTSNTLLAVGPLQTAQKLRMGYILTDYATRYAYNEIRTGQNGDTFQHSLLNIKNYTGQGFRNDMFTQNSMFMFRGNYMWWGASVIFINTEYPAGSSCTWDALNQLLGP
jgi:hypothetical protein